jgi:hypothetical protein
MELADVGHGRGENIEPIGANGQVAGSKTAFLSLFLLSGLCAQGASTFWGQGGMWWNDYDN